MERTPCLAELYSAAIREFMDEAEANHSDNLPVYRTAYPAWWTYGFGSAARETAASRTTQSNMLTILLLMYREAL